MSFKLLSNNSLNKGGEYLSFNEVESYAKNNNYSVAGYFYQSLRNEITGGTILPKNELEKYVLENNSLPEESEKLRISVTTDIERLLGNLDVYQVLIPKYLPKKATQIIRDNYELFVLLQKKQ